MIGVDGDNAEHTIDGFLGGMVEAVQPASGHHRSGLEAVLLAASLDSRISGTVVDLGSGVGVAGFCAAYRCPAADIVLVERDPEAVECARQGLRRPANAGIASRIRIVATDIDAAEADRASAGMGRDLADHVLLNPPFYDAGRGSRSPEPARSSAHVMAAAGLDPWLRAAASVLKVRGDVTLIFRADGLGEVLAAVGRRFGAVDLMPVHPRATLPALRILVRAVKGSRAPLRILPPLVLHPDDGNGFHPPVDAILRSGRALSHANPAWQGARRAPS